MQCGTGGHARCSVEHDEKERTCLATPGRDAAAQAKSLVEVDLPQAAPLVQD